MSQAAPGAVRWAVVDDDDPSLLYSPGWIFEKQASQHQQGLSLESGVPYLDTLHRISGNGSLSFDYHGSNIVVWGFDPGNTTERATWRCFIDESNQIPQRPPSADSVPRNNVALCGDGDLLDHAMGAHRLTINVTTDSPNASFWIDWIQYMPQSGFVFDVTNDQGGHETSMLMDNTDTDIRYDDGWLQYNDETNITSRTQASVMIDFVGTSLSWYGVYPPGSFTGSGQGSYSINDASSEVPFSWQINPSAPTDLVRQHFFSTPDLPFGPHQIVVKYIGPTSSSPPLTLDYLIIKNASILRGLSSSSDAPLPPSGGADSARNGKSITGPIVGGVVGGVLALVVIILLFFCVKHGSRRRKEIPQSRVPTPFTMTYEIPRTTVPVGGLISQENSRAATPSQGHGHSRAGSEQLSQVSEETPMLDSTGGTYGEAASDLVPLLRHSYSHPLSRGHTGQGLGGLPSPDEPLPVYTEIGNGE